MDFIIKKLSEEHSLLVNAFSCTETEAELSKFKSKERRRIKLHSLEMENFLKDEAFAEQNKNLNATHLLIDRKTNAVAGYISLCNDSIQLEVQEVDDMALTYYTIPAMKIARIAVDNRYKHKGLAHFLINFAVYSSIKIRETSGLVFITLDCYKHRLTFYESIGFVKNQKQPVSLPYDSPISMRLHLDDYISSFAGE